jgi:hypothetical protein
MSGIDSLIELGFVDDSQSLCCLVEVLAALQLLMPVGLTDRFNAAVAAKPVINWLSKPLTADSMVGQIYHQFPWPASGSI